MPQPTISRFFSQSPVKQKQKRPASPIDLTADSDSEAPRKKQRKNNGEGSRTGNQVGLSAQKHNQADQWRYEPPSPDKPRAKNARTEAEEEERRRTREKFRKRLLDENSSFVRPQLGHLADDVEKENDEEEVDDSAGEEDAAFASFKEVIAKSKGPARRKKGEKVEELGPSGLPWTPLEKQILQLKKDNPGVLLMVEVGYKIKFFDDDARTAASELGIVCFPHRNFTEAMVPLHRRDIHLKKLLANGHKVGIVTQTETAALKAVSDTKSAPFARRLTALYTAATYVDALDSVDDGERYEAPPRLMCVIEQEQEVKVASGGQVRVAIIAICPATGDVVWDEFEDGHMRIELETRIIHTKPAELLLPVTRLSASSEKMLAHFAENTSGGASTKSNMRIERFPAPLSYTDAFARVSAFYTASPASMEAITGFPPALIVLLAHALAHLSAFGLADALRAPAGFARFTARAHMLLHGNTLANLEIYRNETDASARGSLIWVLDRTVTRFGARLLKSWVGRPLVDKTVLQARVDAVQEIIESTADTLVTLRDVLRKLPDLARGLCRIQYGKCTPQELAVLLTALSKIAHAFEPFADPALVGCASAMLNDVVFALPALRGPMARLLADVSLKRAAEGRKDTMWQDSDKFPAIADIDLAVQTLEAELMDELKSIRKRLKRPSLQYSAAAGEEYLIELKKSDACNVPDSWQIVSRTKSATRYHTPEVKRKLQERAQCKEALAAEAQRAFSTFLAEISDNYYGVIRSAVNSLAVADCLFSLAQVALKEGYVKPEFTDGDDLEIAQGRHPMVEELRSDPFIPNTLSMGGNEPRSKVITGPNMGGKSSCVRMVALIAIMAQIGSYVPAQSVKMGMLDGILTRMGASDEIARGRSTFMVEMTETSEILQCATASSLVILDELGRGTSTVDGMAVASAVLQHLLEVTKCKTLFITHYPLVATNLEKKFPRALQNLHMAYTEDVRVDGTREITFLYQLTRGFAKESFGVECARLAGLPEEILSVATQRSGSMRDIVEKRCKKNIARQCMRFIKDCIGTSNESAITTRLEELQIMIDSMAVSDLQRTTT